MHTIAILAQTDPRVLEALERIATAQVVMAVLMATAALLVLVGAVFIFLQIRALKGALAQGVADVKPHVIPLIDRARSVTEDVAGLTDNVRRKMDDVLHTVEDVRRSVEEGATAAEERVRRFGRVLDVVQDETEDLLLDAAATARGVHATARALRRTRKPGLLRRRRRPKRRFEE